MTELKQNREKLKPRDDLGIEKVEQDFVILDKRNQKVHQLNSTASAIWAILQEGGDADAIVQEIVGSFGISPDVARRDVNRVLDEFRMLGLIEIQV